jgi:hypothetical protein
MAPHMYIAQLIVEQVEGDLRQSSQYQNQIDPAFAKFCEKS